MLLMYLYCTNRPVLGVTPRTLIKVAWECYHGSLWLYQESKEGEGVFTGKWVGEQIPFVQSIEQIFESRL
jgi:hypothetical protein